MLEIPMSLARALQVKNRLAGEIKELRAKVQSYNSFRKDRPPEYDALEVFKELEERQEDLVRLKTAVAVANASNGLYEKIMRRDELKGMIQFMHGIPTTRGKHDREVYLRGRDDEGAQEVEYEAKMTRPDVDKKVKALETQLDDLQQEIAKLNHAVQITAV
jgi:hypothetical protein